MPACLETFDLATSLLTTFTFLRDCARDFSPKSQFKMITRFITEVSTTFNPFLPRAKTARLFLSFLPPNARQTMKIDTKLLPRTSRDPSFIKLKFKDGKQMKLDAEKLGIKGVVEEVDRHSRILSRQEELNGN
ncbi:39S ribosomal protein L53/MRP-L53-domain-containing protein [Hyaloscypha finlandica]|nr:39S ribosomal protein L53/MRP-L53-domain-containing protein [Hyaloscypha finlandica]